MYRIINLVYVVREMFFIIKLNIKEGLLCIFGVNRLSNYERNKRMFEILI